MEGEEAGHTNHTNPTNVGEDAENAQNPERMWAHEWAFNAARTHKGLPVGFAKGDALKEFRAKYNRDPDPDEFEAGVIGGLAADRKRREREESS